MKKNVWFLVCGILSILVSVSFLIVSFIFGSSIALIKSGQLDFTDENGAPLTGAELEAAQSLCVTVFTVLVVFMIILLAMAIFQSVVYLKYFSKSREEVKGHSGLIITAIVFSFLSAGILVGVFGILGYNNIGSQENSSNVHEVTSETVIQNPEVYESVKKGLEDLDRLKENGLINEEEYKQKRQDIINKM